MVHMDLGHPMLFDLVDFLIIIEEFCVILFVLMASWLLYLGIAHLVKVFSLQRTLRTFYKGLANIGNQALFTEYVKRNFRREKNSNRFFFVDLFTGLLEIFQHYRKNRNRLQYLGSIVQIKDQAWGMFSHSSMRAFSFQLTAGIFISIVTAVGIFFRVREVSVAPMLIVATFNLISLWLYMSRDGYSKRAVKEIDKLESIFLKYFNSKENEQV